MNCIRKFWDDSNQFRLRVFAQSQSERYEDAISNYKKIFLAYLDGAVCDCNKDCDNREYCEIVKSTISQIGQDEIEVFFDKLREAYLQWIDADCGLAVDSLEKLLKEYEVLQFKKEINNSDVFFKGRISETALTPWDMFHIPFNKRYLIKNQRFSLTGQPMIYLGTSVIDVVEEIGIEELDKLKLSAVRVKSGRKEGVTVFDLKSNYNDILVDLMIQQLFDEELTFNKAIFYKMILESICSFAKRQELKGFTFAEEYVLPQMLAQVLKRCDFEGVSYYSTKRFDNVSFIEFPGEDYKDIAFKENVAIFTSLDPEHVYDRNLYDRLSISVPVGISQIDLISKENLESIKAKINATEKAEKVGPAEKIYSSFDRIYGRILVNDQQYVNCIYGKLHMYNLYMVLNQILISEEVI